MPMMSGDMPLADPCPPSSTSTKSSTRLTVYGALLPPWDTGAARHVSERTKVRIHHCRRYVRALVHCLNGALVDGRSPTTDDIVRRVAPPVCFRDGGEDERAVQAWGRFCLAVYRAFLRRQHFACLIDTGHLAGKHAPVFSDHCPSVAPVRLIDLVALRADGTLCCVWLTLTHRRGSSVRERALAALVRRRAALVYGTTSIEVIVLAVPSGLWKPLSAEDDGAPCDGASHAPSRRHQDRWIATGGVRRPSHPR